MPNFRAPAFELEFSRHALLMDTNVVYAAFSERDQRKESAQAFIETWDGDTLITAAVIVETWGLLVGRDKNWPAGISFLTWLQDPGNRIFLLPQGVNEFESVVEATTSIHVDCVDAFLMRSANEITLQCSFSPFIRIATYDFGDYLRGRERFGLRFDLINPDTLDVYP